MVVNIVNVVKREGLNLGRYLDIASRISKKAEPPPIEIGQSVSYQTPVDAYIKKGTVELIDENWGMVLIRGDEVAWINKHFIFANE